jgi:hypothetical protein
MRPEYPALSNTRDGKHPRGYYCKVSIFLFAVFVLFSLLGIGGVSGAQVNESLGPGGYGWQQGYSTNVSGVAWARMTASADRDFYDYGYKPINVYVRVETFWSQDCGWWYITGSESTSVSLTNGTDIFNTTSTSTSISSKGVNNITYSWDELSTSAPGRWNVTANDGNHTLTFYIYVRGQLNVTSITNIGDAAGSTVQINASLKDHTGRAINGTFKDNTGNDAFPTVTAYVTGGGEDFTLPMTDPDGDGTWGTTFTPQEMGDHMVVVKASDAHQYWVDGRGSKILSFTGNFPYASLGLQAVMRFFGGIGDGIGDGIGFLTAFLAGIGAIFAAKRRWNHG